MPSEFSITIAPEPARWRALLASRPPLGAPARRFREQLGLPTDRPVMLPGHESLFWHAGTLAKWLAAAHAADALGAAPAWVVVDHDTNEFARVRYPARQADGSVVARQWVIAPASVVESLGPDVPLRAVPAFEPTPTPAFDQARCPWPGVRAGLLAMHNALVTHHGQPDAAAQLARACADLISPLLPGRDPLPLIFASRLSHTEFFAQIVAQMRRDPAACANAYNAALAAHRAPGLAPLSTGPDGRIELPLWHIEPSAHAPSGPAARRRRVYVDALSTIPVERLAPRALMFTALLRLGACDLMIHGTGGAGLTGDTGYEVVTNDWIRRWLGRPLVPTVTVTATLLLPLADGPVVTDEQVAREVWTAHHARHSPRLLGDDRAEDKKRELVLLLRDRRRPRAERATLFARLHTLLESSRKSHAPRLAQLDEQASQAGRQLDRQALLADRTWPFPLHDAAALTALSSAIARAFR